MKFHSSPMTCFSHQITRHPLTKCEANLLLHHFSFITSIQQRKLFEVESIFVGVAYRLRKDFYSCKSVRKSEPWVTSASRKPVENMPREIQDRLPDSYNLLVRCTIDLKENMLAKKLLTSQFEKSSILKCVHCLVSKSVYPLLEDHRFLSRTRTQKKSPRFGKKKHHLTL